MAYWVTFADGSKGCVELPLDQRDALLGQNEALSSAASALASELTGKPVKAISGIPYPAAPRLNRVSYGEHGPMPSFCFSPEKCAGFGSCPRNYACTE